MQKIGRKWGEKWGNIKVTAAPPGDAFDKVSINLKCFMCFPFRIITDSFHQKADLEKWLAPNIHKEDYRELIDALWEPMLAQKLW